MPIIDRLCPKCGCTTKQKMEDLIVPVAQQIPDGVSVDLTGGFYKGNKPAVPGVEGGVQNTMPFTKTYTCMRCGNNLTAIGDDTMNGPPTGSDDFSVLARGGDWRDPGK